MSWEVVDILWLIFFFFNTTEESLFVSAQSLNDTKCGSDINNLIIGWSEIKTRLVSITSITINVLDLPGLIWSFLHLLVLVLLWNSLVNVFEEMLNFSCLDTLLFGHIFKFYLFYF
jgi:hypothetical protein